MTSHLFPVPRHLEVYGTERVDPAAVPITWHDRPHLPDEGYEIEIATDAITVGTRDPAGRRYAAATLAQLADGAPPLRIRDWPDLAVRGFMLDISRNRVPTRATLERLVEIMALCRLNQLQLYMEHTFAYTGHEAVWRDASPMTADDIIWLDARCQELGIELVPNQNTFGHMERWLAHPEYRELAECPDGNELLPGVRLPPALLAATETSAAFVHGLLDELLPLFASRSVHIGCDETFGLGTGASRTLGTEIGVGRLYSRHLQRISSPLEAQGRTVQFWGDVIRAHPELIPELSAQQVPVGWYYEAPRGPDDPPPVTPEIRAMLERVGHQLELDGFRPIARDLSRHEGTFLLAPSTATYNSLVGRLDSATANILDAADSARAFGAGGILVTDWGDNGHLQPPSVSFPPLLYAGAVAWCRERNADVDLPAMLDRHVFEDSAAQLGTALCRLGHLSTATGRRGFHGSPLQAALLPTQLHFGAAEASLAKTDAVIDELGELIATVEASEPACVDGRIVVDEVSTAARLARHGAARIRDELLETSGPDPSRVADLRQCIDRFRGDWMARSRAGGLSDSLAQLETALET